MERVRIEILRELWFAHIAFEYDREAGQDPGGSCRFIMGQISALERALEILDGADALVDDEVLAWYEERKAGKGAGL